MKRTALQAARTRRPALRRRALAPLAALLCWCLTFSAALAQSDTPNVQHTKNTPDLGLRGELKVDPSTLAMSIQIPLGGYPGRAGTSVPLALYYNSKVWRIEFNSFVNGTMNGCGGDPNIAVGTECYTTTRARFAEKSVAGWTFSSMPTIEFDTERYDSTGQPLGQPTLGFYIPRMTARFADGSTHELRRGDAALSGADPMTGTYLSVDSSRLKYVGTSPGKGKLYLPDGSRYDIDNYAGTHLVDRNGNVLAAQDPLGRQIKDTLGRTLTAPSFHNDFVHTETHSIPGPGGTQMNYTFDVRELDDPGVREPDTPGAPPPALRRVGDMNEFSSEVFTESLFASTPEGRVVEPVTFNPRVLHKITLPDNTSYTFTYNVYGEIAKVVYPTGGYERYHYAEVPPLAHMTAPYTQANRGVVERHVSATGQAADEVTWLYAPGETTAPAPDLTRTVQRVHAGYSFGSVVYGFDDPRAGKVYEEAVYAPQSQGGAMLRRALTEWGVAGPLPGGHSSAKRDPKVLRTVEILLDTGAANPLARSTTYQYGQASQPLNPTAVTEHAFIEVPRATAGGGAVGDIPSGAPLRTTETEYKDEQTYSDRNLVALPVNTTVRAGGPGNSLTPGPVVARTEVFYDEPFYAGTDLSPLACGATEGREASTPAARGNATTAGRWLDTIGPAGNSSAYLDTHTRYDSCGSVRQTWDAATRGTVSPRVSGVEYSADYQFAYPTRTLSAVPDPTGAHASSAPLETAGTYDFATGLVLTTTDFNNQTTTYSYRDPETNAADPLGRLRRVSLPDGGWTRYDYGDTPGSFFIRTRSAIDAARATDSYQHFDGLGRPYRKATFENSDAAQPWLNVDTAYDSLGRARLASRPYRSAGGGAPLTPAQWADVKSVETSYDGLGRVLKVVTQPDGARVSTAYAGARVLVTDQANRQRISETDALGRLVEVWEVTPADPSKYPGLEPVSFAPAAGVPAPAAGYRTNYFYDALGNLRRVQQGGQSRFFAYDSLGRLLRSKNPEQGAFAPDAAAGFAPLTDAASGVSNSQWSLGYAYDANGNVTKRRDARNVTATYGYDALNRPTTVRYSDGTKDVNRHYDGAVNGKGRFHYFNWDASNNARFDTHAVVDEYDAMGRPLKYRQHFLTNGSVSPQFLVTRAYDKLGNVTSQTYPSGHAVGYGYDAAGRPSGFTGNLGDGVPRTYAADITYGEFGGLRQERFGTQTPLYHKLHYNRRGQLFDVRLSTVAWAADEWNWNRGAVVNYYSSNYAWEGNPSTPAGADNNGNVMRQQHWVPADDSVSNYTYTQDTYAYDTLNRLTSVSEVHSTPSSQSGQDFAQTYTYDRWGNRTVNLAQSPNVPAAQYDFERNDLANTNRLHAPGDLAFPDPNDARRRMRYDAAGNLAHDGYTGNGGRAYDAENRMTGAYDSTGNWASYTYDADGRRVKRTVHGEETWQVYGPGGELLAEYRAGAAAFLPTKEYGYRGGELLVTMSSGDDQRLKRFVAYLYYGALQRDPTPQELQEKVNQLASAGAQSQAQLQATAAQIARGLFVSTGYETSPYRSDRQYVADLYYAYLQRPPDDGGLDWWVGQLAWGRQHACDAFEGSGEFQAVVSTLYGSASSDDDRTDGFVHRFYLGAYGRGAASTELQQQRGALNAAAAQGRSQVEAQAEAMGRSLFASQVSDPSITDQQYVTNLYEAFLHRGPDAGGLNYWTSIAGSHGRQFVLGSFATSPAFRALSGTLYREAYWLVGDHLGTPRMVADKSGSLASIRRHDYLPFGEEVGAGVSGRTTAQGYVGSNLRQKWTTYERDAETGLDYALNRYNSSAQGRFTSVDPYNIIFEKEKGRDEGERRQILLSYISQPQIWNKYSYTLNNPLKFTDPDGRRPLTEEDVKRLNRLREEAKRTGDEEIIKAAEDAAKAIMKAIDAVPAGQADPANLKAAFWSIDQLGSTEYSEAATHSNGVTATIPAGSPKCNIFVAEAYGIGAGVGFGNNGVPTNSTLLGGLIGRTHVTVANTLADLDANVKNFPTTEVLDIGGIASFANPSGRSGHTGIAVSHNLVIHAASNGVKMNTLGQLTKTLTQQYGARPSSMTWRMYKP